MSSAPLDSTFRLVLLAILAPGMAAAIRYRLRAARAGDKLDRRQEGIFILIALRAAGIGMWIAVLTWMARPSLFAWASFDAGVPARIAGAALVAVGMLWTWWVMRTLGDNLTDTVVTRARATLVTAGPYRWVRNPLYTGLLVLGPALALAADRWIFGAACLTVFALLAVRTAKEEANLIARFGDEYRAYMARTGRFLPRLRRTVS
jgi:protein-S-isoprenylcysteine O-methyltransferase Ste14